MNIINGSWLQTIAQNIFNRDNIGDKNFWHICGQINTINTTPLVLYTPPSGTRFYITDIVLSVDNDNFVRLREGTNGCANIFSFNVDTQANTSLTLTHSFSNPYKSTIDATLRITNTTTATLDYSIQGYFK